MHILSYVSLLLLYIYKQCHLIYSSVPKTFQRETYRNARNKKREKDRKSQFTHESTASHPCSTPLSWISRVPSPRHGRWSRREGSRPVSSGLPLREVFSYWSVRKVSQMALSVSTREREIYSSDIRVWRIERILREIFVMLFAENLVENFNPILFYLSRFFRKYFSNRIEPL